MKSRNKVQTNEVTLGGWNNKGLNREQGICNHSYTLPQKIWWGPVGRKTTCPWAVLLFPFIVHLFMSPNFTEERIQKPSTSKIGRPAVKLWDGNHVLGHVQGIQKPNYSKSHAVWFFASGSRRFTSILILGVAFLHALRNCAWEETINGTDPYHVKMAVSHISWQLYLH